MRASPAFLAVGFAGASFLIPRIAPSMFRVGLYGEDINKRSPTTAGPLIPEALGLPTGCVYLICLVCVPLLQLSLHLGKVSLAEHNAALSSVCTMLLLGFVDDVLDLPWRVKLGKRFALLHFHAH
jgi:UDP-N-acetylglucosamine--dolichyl-phosphate N-acetylglucosaminephosphotransferase